VLRTLDFAISELEVRLKSGDVETDDGLEQIDDFLGIGYVMMQTYISAVVADVKKACAEQERRGLIQSRTEPAKLTLLRGSGNPVANGNATAFELCDAAANYYKHRDDWSGWDVGKATRTTPRF